jgi:predicted nuclease of predicted toxin-antitoxin system
MLFIFDNQCSQRLANGLNILEEGNLLSPIQCQVKHIREFIPGSSTDEEVISLAIKLDGIIVTYDRDFKETKLRAKLYKENNVGVVFFRSYKNVLRYWEIVLSFINNWEKLKKMISETQKPFIIEVTKNGLNVRELR